MGASHRAAHAERVHATYLHHTTFEYSELKCIGVEGFELRKPTNPYAPYCIGTLSRTPDETPPDELFLYSNRRIFSSLDIHMSSSELDSPPELDPDEKLDSDEDSSSSLPSLDHEGSLEHSSSNDESMTSATGVT